MTRDQARGLLRIGIALEKRLHQVPQLREDPDQDPEEERGGEGEVRREPRSRDDRRQRRGHQTRDRALHRFSGAHAGRQAVAPPRAPHDVGRRVAAPREEERKEREGHSLRVRDAERPWKLAERAHVGAQPADVEDSQKRGGSVHERLLARPAAKPREEHRDEKHRDQSRQMPFFGPVRPRTDVGADRKKEGGEIAGLPMGKEPLGSHHEIELAEGQTDEEEREPEIDQAAETGHQDEERKEDDGAPETERQRGILRGSAVRHVRRFRRHRGLHGGPGISAFGQIDGFFAGSHRPPGRGAFAGSRATTYP